MGEAGGEIVSLDALHSRRRLQRFVGRAAQLEQFVTLLERSGPSVLLVWGEGGIGKTSLLDAFEAEARRRGRVVGRLDARYVDLSVPAVLAALDTARAAPGGGLARVVLLDTYEQLEPIEAQLFDRLIRSVQGDVLLVVAGRRAPSAEWRSLAVWGDAVVPMRLMGLTSPEVQAYLATRGMPDDVMERVAAFAHGHPLALALAADTWQNDPTAGFSPAEAPDVLAALYEYFARRVAEPERLAALEVLATLRTTTEHSLGAMLDTDDARELFSWLRGLSFIEPGRRGLLPHDLAREVILAELRWRNTDRLRELVRRARRFVVDGLRDAPSGEVVERLGDLAFVLAHDPDLAEMKPVPGVTLAPDVSRPGDEGQMDQAVLRHEGPEALRRMRYWREQQPSAFKVVRAADGKVAAFGAFLRLDLLSPEQRESDPIVLAVWRWAESLLGPGTNGPVEYAQFVLAVDTGQAPSPAMGMCWVVGARDLLVCHTRIAFARLRSARDWETLVASTGSRFVPELEHDEDGVRYHVTVQDLRKESLVELLAVISASTPLDVRRHRQDAEHPDADPCEQLREALRVLHEPGALQNSPLLRWPSLRGVAAAPAAERAEALRSRIIAGMGALRGTPRGDLWHRVLVAAYVDRWGKHVGIAADLGLSYSTFRRHLTAAVAALADALRDGGR